MNEQRFVEDEIITALECKARVKTFCRGCAFRPLPENGFSCDENGAMTAIAALNIINRQRMKIAELKECITEAQNRATREFAKHLIDKSKNGCIRSGDLLDFVMQFAGDV